MKKKPTTIVAGYQWCPKCESVLPQSAFARDRTRANGLQSKCRDCDNARRLRSWGRKYWTPARIAAYEERSARTAATIAAVSYVRAN